MNTAAIVITIIVGVVALVTTAIFPVLRSVLKSNSATEQNTAATQSNTEAIQDLIRKVEDLTGEVGQLRIRQAVQADCLGSHDERLNRLERDNGQPNTRRTQH